MNTLRNIFSSRTLNYLRQNGQNALLNATQPTAVESATPTNTSQNNVNDGQTAQSLLASPLIPKSITDASHFAGKKFETPTAAPSRSISPTTLDRFRSMQRTVEIAYLCKLCNTRNKKTVSEAAYKSGVVILQCDGCAVDHVIIDNLGWFTNTKNKNFEEVLAGRADRVRVIRVNQHGEIF